MTSTDVAQQPKYDEVVEIVPVGGVRATDKAVSSDRAGKHLRSLAYDGWAKSLYPVTRTVGDPELSAYTRPGHSPGIRGRPPTLDRRSSDVSLDGRAGQVLTNDADLAADASARRSRASASGPRGPFRSLGARADRGYRRVVVDPVGSFLVAVAGAVSDPGRVAAVLRTGLLDTGPEPSFDTLTAAAASLIGTELAFLTLVDDRRSFWKSVVGVPSQVLSERQGPVEESFCQYVIGLDSSFAVSDARVDPRTRGNPSVDQMGVIAWAGEPVRSQDGSVVGSFCVMAGQPREWSATDLEILKVLAASASREVQLWTQVLEYDTLRRRAEALASLTSRLGGDLTTEAAVGVVVEYAPLVLAADLSIVGLIDPSGTHLRVSLPKSLPDEASEPFAIVSVDDATPLTDAVRSGQLVVQTDDQARQEYPGLQRAREAAGVKTSAAAPLRVSSGAIIGALGVAWNHPVDLDPVGRSALSAMASLCGQTIERTWLNDTSKELITALTMQLFPTVPTMPGLDFAGTYRPSDDRLSFGGDWYDAIALDDQRILVIVGDVAGHGVPAAAMMSQIRVVLNTLAQQDTPMGQLVPAAEGLFWQFNGQYLATLALIEIDFANESLSHVSAGHPPLLVRAADGTVTRFGGGRRPPLGIGGAAEPTTVPFPPGSTVVAYTDGLVERRDVPIDQGIDTLAETLRTVGSDDAHTLCEVIIGTVLASSPRQDDIATVVITHRATTPPLDPNPDGRPVGLRPTTTNRYRHQS